MGPLKPFAEDHFRTVKHERMILSSSTSGISSKVFGSTEFRLAG
jgi:hypothetical protein